MSKNANVTAGYTFTPDSQNRISVTMDRLNLIGQPVVTVDLEAQQVATAEIAASAVSGAKLADTVADAILTATATVGNTVAHSNPIAVALQVKDIQGNALAATIPIWWWLTADPAAPVPCATTAPSQALVYTTGLNVFDKTTNAVQLGVAAAVLGLALTDATGLLTISFQHNGGALTRYFRAIVGGKLISGSQALAWT